MNAPLGKKIKRFLITLGVNLMPFFPLPPEWYRKLLVKDSESRYSSGGWSYQRDISETHRYSIINGWIDYYIPNDRKVLDVGCGEGILQKRMSYTKYVGVDMNPEAIQLAQARADANTRFICMPAEHYTPEEKFDVIVFNESLYYIKDPMQVLERYRPYLATDGILIICMFKTYLGRKIWQAIEKTNMLELSGATISNEVGFSSIIKLYSNLFLLNQSFQCTICQRETYVQLAEHLLVPSDSRRMLNEFFVVWRCPLCRSLHTLSHEPLDPASKGMPASYMQRQLNPYNRIAFEGFHRWLERKGVQASLRVLFYGTNAPLFQQFFREKGYAHFDIFEDVMNDQRLASLQPNAYDVVIILDYLERTPKPHLVFEYASQQVKTGGLLILHAPDAGNIHLPNAHLLQQPYRLHIASWAASKSLAETCGFQCQSVERRSYQDTLVPFINFRAFHDMPLFLDGSQEAAFDFRPRDVWRKWWRIPRFLALGLFGGIWRDPSNVLAVFKKLGR